MSAWLSLILIIICASCGGAVPVKIETSQRTPEKGGTIFSPTYCDSKGMNGHWAYDCARSYPYERCLPALTLRYLCHQAGPPHVFAADTAYEFDLGRSEVKTPLGICDNSVKAWRVFRLQVDRSADDINPNTLAQIDGQAGRSWVGNQIEDCYRQSTFADSLTFAQDNPHAYFLMMGEVEGDDQIVIIE